MFGGLAHREYRSEADISAFHQLAPLGTRSLSKQVGKTNLQGWPRGRIHLLGKVLVAFKAGQSQEFGVELRLDRTDRNVGSVSALICVVKVRSPVEEVGARSILVEYSDRFHRPEHRHQNGRTVDHRGVNDLAGSTALRFE